MSESDWDEEDLPPPLCPIPTGPRSISRSPQLPDELVLMSWRLARLEHPHEWFTLDAEVLRWDAWAAVTSFDAGTDCRLAEIVGPIYMAYRDLMPPEIRAFFIDEVIQAVSEGHCRPDGLGFLVWFENEPLLIARVAASFTDAIGVAEQNPFPAVEMLLDGWDDDPAERRAGIFLGLLVLGCPEILEELRVHRYELTDDEVSMICDARIAYIYNTTVDFMLEWLEEVQAHGDRGKFAMLATFITTIGADNEEQELEAEAADWRQLSIPGVDEGILNRCYFPIDRHSMGRYLAPRLRAIARQEVGTHVMPALLEAYGLDCDGEAS